MTTAAIAEAVQGRFLVCSPDEHREIRYAFASDLMSDVLTLTQEDILFITGLVAPQTIRTAVVSDIHTILIVRGKPVPQGIVELAASNGVCLIVTTWSMYRSSGVLYAAGLEPVY